MGGKTDFSKQENRDACEYHCWVNYKPNATWNGYKMKPRMSYLGYLTDKDKGLARLKNFVIQRASIITNGQIYNHQNNTLLMEWNETSQCWK